MFWKKVFFGVVRFAAAGKEFPIMLLACFFRLSHQGSSVRMLRSPIFDYLILNSIDLECKVYSIFSVPFVFNLDGKTSFLLRIWAASLWAGILLDVVILLVPTGAHVRLLDLFLHFEPFFQKWMGELFEVSLACLALKSVACGCFYPYLDLRKVELHYFSHWFIL